MTAERTNRDASPILATKLRPPVRRVAAVIRERLRPFTGGERPGSLTLVSAPAGFGKTTLLVDWAMRGDDSPAWVSLDPTDNDPARFWRHLSAAVSTIEGGAASTPAGDMTGTDAAIALLNHLESIDQRVVIVLDDYHVIEAPLVHEAVGFFVEQLPPNVHVVIGSRVDPPLPLARWRARGELAEVRAADLRFTPSEVASYLNDSMRLGLSGSDIERLDARTEGWIAALQLAALSLRGRDDVGEFIDSFAGDDRFVVDYLAAEVLDRQSSDVREFLLRTSVLERLTGPLCDAINGGTGGKAMLESLERSNLFLVALDDQRRWYRYHHLFADVLRARLLDEEPSLVPDLHLRASRWFQENGLPQPAIEHALLAGDAARAAQLIEQIAPAMRQAREEATLRRWLEAVPVSVYADRPVLAMCLVGARMATGDVTGVEALVDGVERAISPGSGPTFVTDQAEYARLPSQIAVYRAALALMRGDLDEVVRQASRARELADPTDHLGHGSAAALTGLARWHGGELAGASADYRESIDRLELAGHIADVLGCSLALADLHIARGHLGDAEKVYRDALDLAGRHGVVRGTADMHVGLAMLLIEQNDMEGAEHRLELATSLGEHAGLPQNAYRRRVAAGLLAAARGDLVDAVAWLDEAAAYYDTDFSPPIHPVAARRARLHVQAGDLAAARAWVRDEGIAVDDSLDYVSEFAHVTLARVLVADFDTTREDQILADATSMLERLLVAAEAAGRLGSVVDILVTLAAAKLAARSHQDAAADLSRALDAGRSEGYARVFLDVMPPLTSLIDDSMFVSNSASPDDVVPDASARRSPRRAAIDLSDRELDVLRLLRSDLSGPEIARELHISLNTFRTHTKHIYDKLGSSTRRQAVTRAFELGL